jgi:hypothetical protein
VTPTPTPPPSLIACPVGYIHKIFGSTIVCVSQNQQQQQQQNNHLEQNNNNKQEVNVTVNPSITNTNNNNVTVNGSGSTSSVTISSSDSVKVAGVSVVNQVPTYVKELPKTGLPLAAIAVTGLFPLASRLRRLGKKSREEETANSIWMKKHLK